MQRIAFLALLVLAFAPDVRAAARPASEVHQCGWCHPPCAGGEGCWTVPSSPSELCLGCHDGTVGALGQNGNSVPAARAGHPVGVVYEPGGKAHLRPLGTPCGTGGTIGSDLLHDGMIECTYCHDVHHSSRRALLSIDNRESGLCLTCHDR